MPAQVGIRSFGFPERIEKAVDPTARIPARADMRMAGIFYI